MTDDIENDIAALDIPEYLAYLQTSMCKFYPTTTSHIKQAELMKWTTAMIQMMAILNYSCFDNSDEYIELIYKSLKKFKDAADSI